MKSIALGLICLMVGSLSAQETSDAVYEPQPNNTAKFYNVMKGTSPQTSFNLGDAVFVQFLFSEKMTGQIPEGEQCRAVVYCNGKEIATEKFKPDDAVLPVYFDNTYSLDLNVIANSSAFKEIKSLTEATATDRSFSVLMFFIEGLYRDMMTAAFGKLGEGNHTIKVALESGKDEFDQTRSRNAFKTSKTFSSGEFTLKVTDALIASFRKDILSNFGEVINRGFSQVTDNGVKSDAHKQNKYKIAFSNAPITEQTASSAFKTSFSTMTDGIYGRIYLPASAYNMSANFGQGGNVTSYEMDYYLDGVYITTISQTPPADIFKTATTWELPIAPKGDVAEMDQAIVYTFAKALVKASVGKHTFKVVTSISYLNTWNANTPEVAEIATGEFELNVVAAEREALLKKLCPNLPWVNNHIKLVPDAVSMIESTKRADEKVLKVVVYDNDWTYQRNFWGIILRRTIRGKGIIQNTKTNLCFEIDILFSQENTSSGGSSYASTQFQRWGEYDSSVWFSAACIK